MPDTPTGSTDALECDRLTMAAETALAHALIGGDGLRALTYAVLAVVAATRHATARLDAWRDEWSGTRVEDRPSASGELPKKNYPEGFVEWWNQAPGRQL